MQSAALPDQQLQVCEPSTAVIAGGKDACSLGKFSRQGKDISIQRSGHGILPASRTLSCGIAVLPGGFGVTVHIAVAADGAGVGGVTLFRAGGDGDYRLIFTIMDGKLDFPDAVAVTELDHHSKLVGGILSFQFHRVGIYFPTYGGINLLCGTN